MAKENKKNNVVEASQISSEESCKIKLYNLELDEFKKIKTAPKNRWYHSVLAFLIATISVFAGVLIVCLIIIFSF